MMNPPTTIQMILEQASPTDGGTTSKKNNTPVFSQIQHAAAAGAAENGAECAKTQTPILNHAE